MNVHMKAIAIGVATAVTICALQWSASFSAQNQKSDTRKDESTKARSNRTDAAADKTGAAADLRSGKNFIETPVYSLEDDRKILKIFEGLRVADVSDGMDQARTAFSAKQTTPSILLHSMVLAIPLVRLV